MREALDVGEPNFEFRQNLEHTFCFSVSRADLSESQLYRCRDCLQIRLDGKQTYGPTPPFLQS